MEIRELAAFVHAYERGSFTGAARDAFVSRQALSKTMAQLERELGPLFTREARGVRPTALADAVYPHARQAVASFEAILGEARLYASGRTGRLVLGLESNGALTLPPGLTSAYAALRPGIDLKVLALPGGMASDALGDGRVDAIVAGPPCGDGLLFEPVLSSTLTVVFSARVFPPDAVARWGRGSSGGGVGGPSASDRGAPRLAPEALAGQTVFGVSPTNYVERRLVPYLAARGIDARVTYDCTDTALATSEMESGMGGVIVEGAAALRRFGDARYAHVPLCGDGAPTWEIGVVYRPGCPRAPIVGDFAAFARAFVAGDREGACASPGDPVGV